MFRAVSIETMAWSATVCLKKLLLISNALFIKLGFILTGYGVYLLVTQGVSGISANKSLMVSGLFILLVSIFGFRAVIMENYCMVLAYAVILFVFFIIRLGYGLHLLVIGQEESLRLAATEELFEVFRKYQTDEEERSAFHGTQLYFGCCGVNGWEDYKNLLGDGRLPSSCCGYYKDEPCTVKDNPFERSCVDVTVDRFKEVLQGEMTTCIVLGVVELFSAIFSMILAISFKKQMRMRSGEI